MLDALIHLLTLFIAILIVTGGGHWSAGGSRLELSQVDAFAWELLGLLAWRRARRGAWLTPLLGRLAWRAASLFERRPRTLLGMGVTLYVVLQAWISTWRFDSFHANAWDLGFMSQALWSTAHGAGFLHSDMAQGGTWLGEHFSPALAIAALPYLVTDSIRGLFVFQALVLAAGAPLAYALARSLGAGRGAAALAGLCVLAYRPLRAANVFDFHEDDLFVPVFFGLLLALVTRRRAVFWLMVLASWTVKETAPIVTALVGAWLALRRDDGEAAPAASVTPGPLEPDGAAPAPRRGPGRADGIVLVVTSLIAFYVLFAVVTPHFAGAGETVAARRLGELGGTPGQILGSVATRPWAFWSLVTKALFRPASLMYLAQIGAPFVAFVGAAPAAAGIALAGALFNITLVRHGVGFHYECVLIPFLFYVLAAGLARDTRRGGTLTPTRFGLVVLSFLLFFDRSPIDTLRSMQPRAHDRAVGAALAALPREATVATHAALYPHVTHRRVALLLPRGLASADWVAIDSSGALSRYDTPDLKAVSDSLARLGATPVSTIGSFTLWRGAATAGGR